MPQNQLRQNRTIIVQTQNNPCSMPGHCGHKDELTNHMHAAVNSYAPVRCLRMGAFCIALFENHSPLWLLIWPFLHSLGEREKHITLRLCAAKGGE